MSSPTRTIRGAITCLTTVLVGACMLRTPHIDGGPGAPQQPSTLWPTTQQVRDAASKNDALVVSTPRLRDSVSLSALTLADAIDLALRNNPATRISWSQARTAADVYGSTRGRFLPQVTGEIDVTRSRALAQPGRPAFERTQFGPTATLSFMALDFGGRSGSIEAAKQTAIAADLAHNAVVEGTILQVESALFTYLASRALRDAQRISLDEARAVLAAAEQRHKVGLATIADELQARTALSQAELALETLDGELSIARGSLAVSIGYPANTSVDIGDVPATDSVGFVVESVDSLIARAVRLRPELAQARAQAAAASADVRAARSASYPSLVVGSSGGLTGFQNTTGLSQRAYSVNLGVRVPLFSGLSTEYQAAAAADERDAALARLQTTRQQIVLQVFSSYYALQTATRRVHTSADLLASATQSETVARARYKEGVGNIVDLLIAQSALATARGQYVQARWEWRTSLAQLAHDVGALGLRGEPLIPMASDTTGAPR
jgi:outer membrane protein